MKKITLYTKLFSIVIGISIFNSCTRTIETPSQSDGIIRGYVYTEVSSEKEKREQILLPDVTVTIKDEKGSVVDEVKSKLDGNYSTKNIKKGKYKICLNKTGFNLSCYDVTVENASNHPGPLKLNLNNENYIWGTAKLKDSSAGYFNQQVFGVNIDTKISSAINGSSAQTRCNIYGYYVLPEINYKGNGEVKANCENSEAIAHLNGQRRIDLTFRNSNPQISSIVAYSEVGKSILRTNPSKKIKLVANVKDDGNYKLHYKWIPFGNFPGFVSQDAPEVIWELPAKNGKYEMDLMVLDNYGGVSYKSFSIGSADGLVNFSGIVTNIDGSGRIPNALIKVNGQFSTTTDAKGYFSFKVPENENERYVLNVIKPGYSLYSTIYTHDAVQKDYKLVTVTTQTFNPTTDIEITERDDKYTKLEENKEKRSPASLFIPKNSIVDSSGKLITVPVDVSIRSIDITTANGQMPGNFGGVKDGKNVRLESFGAVDVQVRDKANPNIKYNIANTSKAELNLPILTSQLTKATNNITLWDYNETTGMWESVGTAVKLGNYYKGTTNKFSVLNADFEFNSGTYIVLKDNPSNSVFTHPGPIAIKLFAPQATGGVVQGYHVVDNLQPSDLVGTNGLVVVNLPANTVITVQIISNGTVINTINPRTGPVVPGSVGCCPPPSPLPPYDPTVEQIDMLPTIPVIDQNQLNQFLTAEENSNGATDADNYYTFIGAYDYNSAGHHITFQEWKTKNGYNSNGTGDVNSVYFNAGDLAFWRGMHQKTNAGITSYYVSNFANDNDAINDAVNVANNSPTAIATVCMEYSQVTSGSGNVNVTKFYVFNSAGILVNFANLDANNFGPNNGQKFVPGLCITCHGGANLSYTGNPNFNNATTLQSYFNSHTAEVPNFLPFDAKSFFYSTATGYLRTDQEDNIRKLNNTVLSVQKTQAIVDFVNTSYNNVPNNIGQGFIDNAVVNVGGTNTWNTLTPVNTVIPSNFYVDVVGTSCRTCHISRTDPLIWWDTKQKFINKAGGIFSFVCTASPNKYMPNSKVTFINFWTSEAPKRYEEVGKFLFNNSTGCP